MKVGKPLPCSHRPQRTPSKSRHSTHCWKCHHLRYPSQSRVMSKFGKKFNCGLCDRKFNTRNALIVHANQLHPREDKKTIFKHCCRDMTFCPACRNPFFVLEKHLRMSGKCAKAASMNGAAPIADMPFIATKATHTKAPSVRRTSAARAPAGTAPSPSGCQSVHVCCCDPNLNST